MRVGLVYELLGSRPGHPGDPEDADVEYEPEDTIVALEEAVCALGHEPVRLGAPGALLARLGKGEGLGVEVAWNIAEGYGSRNREAWAPVLLEMAGVPSLGSDALTLSLSLDKAWTRTAVAAAGVPVAAGALARSGAEARSLEIPGGFPLFVKPRWEGTAKGIGPWSVAADREALVSAVERVVSAYAQPALVEHFLPGPEYTVTVVGNEPPRALPVLQRALECGTGIGVHAVERHAPPGAPWRSETPGRLDVALERLLEALALRAYAALECLDFARTDFRLDADGAPVFLEINPLPTFAPDGSFGILAELEGRAHAALLAEVLACGLTRLGLA